MAPCNTPARNQQLNNYAKVQDLSLPQKIQGEDCCAFACVLSSDLVRLIKGSEFTFTSCLFLLCIPFDEVWYTEYKQNCWGQTRNPQLKGRVLAIIPLWRVLIPPAAPACMPVVFSVGCLIQTQLTSPSEFFLPNSPLIHLLKLLAGTYIKCTTIGSSSTSPFCVLKHEKPFEYIFKDWQCACLNRNNH